MTLSKQQIQNLDKQHQFHPFTDFKDFKQTGGNIISKAEHIYIYDADGKQYLDGMSGLWCCNLGYSQTKIADAVYQQLQELPYYNNFFQCANQPSIELSKALSEITPDHLNTVFFTNSGSEANDTVIRIAHRYWDLQGKPNKKIFIGRNNGYHGSTVAAASLGGMGFMHEQFTTLDYVKHIQQPYWFGEGGELSENEFGKQAALALEQKIDEIGEDNIAAFIAEPIQGAGGVVVPPESYWPEIRRICEQRNILLVCDEVICGFGRTGEWFGNQYYDVKPDLMPFAKAVTNGFQPLGGVMIGDNVADVLSAHNGEFGHGFTYSGHPVASAAALATINIMHSENIVTRIKDDIGPYLQKRWAQLSDHPIVGQTRGVGMLAALELVKKKQTKERLAPDSQAGAICRSACGDSGLVMRAVGDQMIIAPPVIMTHDEVDSLIERATLALDLTARHFNI